MTKIHPTAIIEDGAKIHETVSVGAYAIIGKNVTLGKDCVVHHHALIQGYTTIGEGNEIYSFASIGNTPQDLKYKGEETYLIIGDKNIFREFTTIQPGTVQGNGKTVIGNKNFFMAYVHVAHDCIIGNSCILANMTQLSGHVTLHDHVFCSGFSAVHQFCQLGSFSMMSGGTQLTQDLPPYSLCEGRNYLHGMNVVALRRNGFSKDLMEIIKEVYKEFFHKNHPTIDETIQAIPSEYKSIKEIQYFIEFVVSSKRGVCRPQRN